MSADPKAEQMAVSSVLEMAVVSAVQMVHSMADKKAALLVV